MKKFITACALLIATISIATAQTSMTEYNYLTKGYKLDLETGRDLKNGYKLVPLTKKFSQPVNSGVLSTVREVSVFKFIDISKGKTIALLLIQKRIDTDHTSYICVPSTKSVDAVRNKASNDFFELRETDSADALAAYHYYWLSLQVLADTNID